MQGGDHHQTALVALRTALDVDACEASHHGRRGFPGQHGQRELREEAATHCQFRAPTTIAYYPLVTNAHEATNVVHCITGFM